MYNTDAPDADLLDEPDEGPAGPGDNSKIGGIAAEALRQFISRIEQLEEERRAVGADIKDVYSQAKSQGFDTKIMRRIVKERRMADQEREEIEQTLDIYKAALGML